MNITTSTGQPWLVEDTISDNSVGCDKVLSTSGTYIDRNIKLNIKAQAGAANATDAALNLTAGAGAATLDASTGMTLATSAPTSGDYYTLTATGKGTVSGTADGSAKITTAGWFDTQTLTSKQATGSKVSNTAIVKKYVAKQAIINNQNLPSDATSSGTIDSGKYIKIAAGYNPSTLYYKAQSTGELTQSTLANSATAGVSYADISSIGPEIPAEGYLYINEGYTTPKKISLSRLIADAGASAWASGIDANVRAGYNFLTNDGKKVTGSMADVAQTLTPSTASITALKCGESVALTAGYLGSAKTITAATLASQTAVDSGKTAATAASLRSGYQAWVNGNKITGSMPNAVIISGSSTISSLTYKYNSTNGNYDITGSATISAPTVGTAGYISSSDGTKNTGTAKVAATIAATSFNTNATLPSGTSSSGTIVAGNYIKISAGYNPSDKYYKAPAQADGTKATVTSGSATISSLSYTYDSTNKNYKVTGSATVSAPTVGTAGYISSSAGTRNTNTATVSTTLAASAISGALVVNSSTTSGYSAYRVTASAGYNPSALTKDITVYQGAWT